MILQMFEEDYVSFEECLIALKKDLRSDLAPRIDGQGKTYYMTKSCRGHIYYLVKEKKFHWARYGGGNSDGIVSFITVIANVRAKDIGYRTTTYIEEAFTPAVKAEFLRRVKNILESDLDD